MLREEVIAFLHSYAAGEYAAGEHARFLNWLNTASLQEIEECIKSYATIAEKREPDGSVSADMVMQIEAALNRTDERLQRKTTVGRGALVRIGRWLAAAAVVVGLSVTGYRMLQQDAESASKIASITLNDVPAPTSSRATLILGDGSVVELGDKQKGTLSRQHGVEIIGKGKEGLVYKQVSQEALAEVPVSYNILHNPPGSNVVSLTLADGTRVWLNAASSLRYPVNFGEERKVEITGEAYFEVARERHRKFIVDAAGVRTKVLGTHFNVNAYKDEGQTAITLLEGSVAVEMDNREPVLLEPGEQAVATSGIRVSKEVDTRAAVAWKNGMFVMRQADIGSIMRQIERWYDVEVKYVAGVPKGTVSGEVSRELNLSEILKVLEYSDIRVKIEEGKAIVLP